eukprot:10209-Pelagomonas_calceolata.AAC.4
MCVFVFGGLALSLTATTPGVAVLVPCCGASPSISPSNHTLFMLGMLVPCSGASPCLLSHPDLSLHPPPKPLLVPTCTEMYTIYPSTQHAGKKPL